MRLTEFRRAGPAGEVPEPYTWRELLAALDGEADVALFTSGAQVDHVMQAAGELGLREAVLAAARQMLVASVGPVCSAGLRRHGLPVQLEPEHPKLGHLLVAVARQLGGRACP